LLQTSLSQLVKDLEGKAEKNGFSSPGIKFLKYLIINVKVGVFTIV
jgi:hypothetical protein